MKPYVRFFLTMAVFATTSMGKFLSEKPSFLTPCKRVDPGFEQCFLDDFQKILVNWKDGVPGLESIGSLDPLHIKRITIASDGNGPVSLNGEMTNIKLAGISNMKMKDFGLDIDKRVITVSMSAPKLNLNSNYVINGRILAIPLNGKGTAGANIENAAISIAIRYKLRTEGELTFMDINKLRCDIGDVGKFSIHLDNLFNGQEVLEQSTNAVLNENWRDLLEVIRPQLTRSIETVLSDYLTKIFQHLPITFLIEDLVNGA